MKRSAVAIRRIGCTRLLEGRDGADAIAEPLTQLAEHEPGRRIVRCEFERLYQQISGPGEIPLGLTGARPFEAAVGD